jgi:hypothetical protein
VPTGNILALAPVDRHTTWAAGFSATSDGKATALHPLLLAGDGRTGAWHRVTTPADGLDSRINALSVRTPGDAWLVGDNPDTSPQEGQPVLTEHWNGTGWQIAYAPVPANTEAAGFLGVTASGPGDAWAVGWAQVVDSVSIDPVTGLKNVVTHDAGLLEHWDGTAWSQVALPASAVDVDLNAVTTAGPGDVWATGETSDGTDQPVALHYDGQRWRKTSVPRPGLYGELNAVVASGPDDVWAVGRAVLTATDHGHPLVEHWDGRRWQTVAAPGTGQLQGATLTATGLAVVGYDNATGAVYGQSLSGGRWASLGLPTVGDYTGPVAVAATGAGLVVSGAYDVVGQPGPIPLLLAEGR